MRYDVTIIGAGHNGLVASSYLAKAGFKVCVLERRSMVGGAAITEELFPGFRYSRASYVLSLFRPQIMSDLGLKERHGVKLLQRDPHSFTPTFDGRSLMMYDDVSTTQESIAQFSGRDAEQYGEYAAQMARIAATLDPLMDRAPPDLDSVLGASDGSIWARARALSGLASFGSGVLNNLRPGDMSFVYQLMAAPAGALLNRWFESEPLRCTLATDAVIGVMAAPSTPASAYMLLHHSMGGAWSYVRGGMGALTAALRAEAERLGVDVLTDAPVEAIEVDRGRACGVRLRGGDVIEASRAVVSNATPRVTLEHLLPPGALPAVAARAARDIDYTSATTKINVALSDLPNFAATSTPPGHVGPEHRGTMHFVDTSAQLEDAYRDAAAGLTSRRPVVEMTVPSALDDSLAPAGKHVASLFVQYTPYAGPWTPDSKRRLADSVYAVIDQHAPGFSASVMHEDILTPPDLERELALTGGSISHGAMTLSQLFWARPATPFAQYRTPIQNLYLCGAGTHPGGGVTGAPGHNCSNIILQDLG